MWLFHFSILLRDETLYWCGRPTEDTSRRDLADDAHRVMTTVPQGHGAACSVVAGQPLRRVVGPTGFFGAPYAYDLLPWKYK